MSVMLRLGVADFCWLMLAPRIAKEAINNRKSMEDTARSTASKVLNMMKAGSLNILRVGY